MDCRPKTQKYDADILIAASLEDDARAVGELVPVGRPLGEFLIVPRFPLAVFWALLVVGCFISVTSVSNRGDWWNVLATWASDQCGAVKC